MDTLCKKAIITGIGGQDAAYLADLLLKKDYKVYGTYRRTTTLDFWRLRELEIEKHPNLFYIECDLIDFSSCLRIVKDINPLEIYNLAAQSFVGASFTQPISTVEINTIGALNFLESIRIINPKIKFYQASTSEMFGKVKSIPQTEETPFHPRSPYGVSKQGAHWLAINYRESYNIFASCGILFNHESPLRGKEFVTRKITDGLTRVKLGLLPFIEIGNIYSKRDWGFSGDYVESMWKMLQCEKPDDYILATGITYTIKDFINFTCKYLNINIEWIGDGIDEKAIDKDTCKVIIVINPKFYRPCEVDLLIGDYTKAKNKLGFEPKTSLEKLCQMMVESDIKRIRKEINNI